MTSKFSACEDFRPATGRRSITASARLMVVAGSGKTKAGGNGR
jgi:hypothetical protein